MHDALPGMAMPPLASRYSSSQFGWKERWTGTNWYGRCLQDVAPTNSQRAWTTAGKCIVNSTGKIWPLGSRKRRRRKHPCRETVGVPLPAPAAAAQIARRRSHFWRGGGRTVAFHRPRRPETTGRRRRSGLVGMEQLGVRCGELAQHCPDKLRVAAPEVGRVCRPAAFQL